MISKQRLINFINDYIALCKEINDFENDCYITAMEDVLSFIDRLELMEVKQ